jgi:hypothetical protein
VTSIERDPKAYVVAPMVTVGVPLDGELEAVMGQLHGAEEVRRFIQGLAKVRQEWCDTSQEL